MKYINIGKHTHPCNNFNIQTKPQLSFVFFFSSKYRELMQCYCLLPIQGQIHRCYYFTQFKIYSSWHSKSHLIIMLQGFFGEIIRWMLGTSLSSNDSKYSIFSFSLGFYFEFTIVKEFNPLTNHSTMSAICNVKVCSGRWITNVRFIWNNESCNEGDCYQTLAKSVTVFPFIFHHLKQPSTVF